MGTVVADRVVVAAGAWSRMLLDDLGVHLNLAAAKGYSITVQGPQDRLATPMVLMEPHLALNPLPQGLRISSRYEVTSPGDRRLDGARLRKLVRSASLHLEIGANPEIAYAWTGNRPAMADGFPVIGPVPSAPEVIVCTGHGMIGTTTALGSAVLVPHT